MGQKTHPIGFRIGIIRPWLSKWYAKKEYAKWLHEDIKFRDLIKKRLQGMGIAKIDIDRASTKVKIIIHTSRPGLVIGKKGSGIDALKVDLQKMTKNEVFLNIQEVRRPELDAYLVAENIALQLERRVAYRRAMKKAVQMSLKFGAKGIKIKCGGRLAGSEIARSEWYREGRVPLHTLRADIDYGLAEANTTYGIIGVKVWIYRGDVVIQ
ncbi:MAG TPA: 30S ribosomal protein S3 [Deltaproteobacteria bacterium]|nr:MAG: 30S ribosomal protein S3 [Deltaproteobacteria bacterium GWA2_45_12]HBF13583.1 30S ribosomal protein S3 [Deltaproteobacteria bacterium]